MVCSATRSRPSESQTPVDGECAAHVPLRESHRRRRQCDIENQEKTQCGTCQHISSPLSRTGPQCPFRSLFLEKYDATAVANSF
jgi:hypothetical protein